MSRRNLRLILPLILLLTLLAACGPEDTPLPPLPTETSPPTETSEPAQDDPTPTVVVDAPATDTPEATSEPSPTETPEPTATPEPPAAIELPEAYLALEVPAGWERVTDPEATSALPPFNRVEWMPADAGEDDAETRLGLHWAELLPPQEPEAVLLPGPSQVVSSEELDLGWAEGRRVVVEVFGPAGKGMELPVATYETHVLVTTAYSATRLGYDFYVSAPSEVGMEALHPLLERVVASAEFVAPPVPPIADLPGPLTYTAVEIPDAGLTVQVPESWVRLEPEWIWSPTDDPADELRIGVRWEALTPPQEIEALLLPSPSQVLDAEEVELLWAETPARWITLQLYEPESEGGDVHAIQKHVLVAVAVDGETRAYDFYTSAPDADALATLDAALATLVTDIVLAE